MADVTIGQLNPITPSTSLSIPASDGTTTGRVTISQINALASGVPIGFIGMWSGSTIPSGWALCDGSNGTPDLRDKFIVGSGSSYAIGATGGSADAIVVSHTHSINDPGHAHSSAIVGPNRNAGTGASVPWFAASGSTSSNTTGISINSTGSSGTNANLPPYYALAYIQKIS